MNATSISTKISDTAATVTDNPVYAGLALAGGVAVVGLAYWYYVSKEHIRSDAITVHDTIRTLRRNLRKAEEAHDSRTQWAFQEDESYTAIDALKDNLSDLEDRSDKALHKIEKKRGDELTEIEDLLTDWGQEGPDYYTKDAFRQDIKHINDIIERW